DGEEQARLPANSRHGFFLEFVRSSCSECGSVRDSELTSDLRVGGSNPSGRAHSSSCGTRVPPITRRLIAAAIRLTGSRPETAKTIGAPALLSPGGVPRSYCHVRAGALEIS